MSRHLQLHHFLCWSLVLIQFFRATFPHPQSSDPRHASPGDDPAQPDEDLSGGYPHFPFPARHGQTQAGGSNKKDTGQESVRQFRGSICVGGTNSDYASHSDTEKSYPVIGTDNYLQPSIDVDNTLGDDEDVDEHSSESNENKRTGNNSKQSFTTATFSLEDGDRQTTKAQHTSTESPIDIPCDNYVCDCTRSKKKASCCGRNFKVRHIPRVPAYVRTFRLWMASIVSLTREKLSNISNFNIEDLDLNNNRIKFLSRDTFVDFHSLKSLTIGENPIAVEMLRDAFHSINLTSFSVLRLDSMILGDTLPIDFLGAFDNHTLRNLSLVGNGLTVFDTRVFAGLKEVDKLFLTDNDIERFNLRARVGIKTIKMDVNSINTLPELCMPNGEAALPILISLYLRSNPLRQIPAGSLKGRCLPRLLKLDISGSSASRLENNFISDLPRLQNLMAGDMQYLNRYEPYCFNSSSLERLFLVNNKAWVRGTVDPANVFAHSPSLMNLQMSNTQINLVDDLFRPILLSLKSLQALKMQCCKVGSIPPDTLWRMSRLRELDLTSNRINSFTLSKALKNVTQIQRLNLRGNNINTVNESTIPLEVRQSVKIMDLSGNPYDCTCKLLWFKSWVEEEQKYGNVSFGNWPRQYVCNTPAKWKHTRVSDYNPSYRDCHPVNIFIVVGGAGGSFVFLFISTVSLVYRYRWYLRYYIYRLRRRRQYKYERLRNEEDEPIEYSIYLAYSEQDLEWVMTEMLPFLETQAQQKVFLKNRDIKGGTVADNIVLNMDRSERVLLVLTDAYTREGWSGYEFQHVLYACIEQSKDVIVVLKGDLEAGRMTKYMRRMLTKGTFLQWDDSEQARSAFKDGLMVALGTGGNMQAVC